jgi:hypothetical protein
MGKIAISAVADAPLQAFNAGPGITAEGEIQSRAVVAAGDRPLWLRRHELAPGATLTITRPPGEHLFYVFGGAVESADLTNPSTGGDPARFNSLPETSVVALTRGASARITAGADGAKLLHFSDANRERAFKGRPHVHQVGPDGIFKGRNRRTGAIGILWLDSQCPDCRLWLQRSGSARTPADFHAHTEDEIIFILTGEMHLGKRVLKPATALAIDGNTRYSFSRPEGCSFLNFRPSEPFIVWYEQGKGGMVALPPQRERELWAQGYEPLTQVS